MSVVDDGSLIPGELWCWGRGRSGQVGLNDVSGA